MPGAGEVGALPPRRRDEEMDWHDLMPATCPDCSCEQFYAKDDPSIVWEPGSAWDPDCSDRGCHCHTAPIEGARRP